MAKYLVIAKTLLIEFRVVKIKQVGRDLNYHAQLDALAGLASVFEWEVGQTIAVDLISVSSCETHQENVLTNIKLGLSWMDAIIEFLHYDKLPKDKRKMHKLQVKVAWF